MTSDFRIVIPARYESTRLPGKVLLPVAGKPMLQHVWERATESGAAEIVVATDSDEVAESARSFGANVCMTRSECRSGTERVAEVCAQRGWDNQRPVVNVQGDAPLMPPQSIKRVASLLDENPSAALATLCTPLQSVADYEDPNVVKVVFDQTGRALYFSRSPIPAAGHGVDSVEVASHGYRHLGLYAYRPDSLARLSAAEPCKLEQHERLEQLRALWLGMEIRIAVDERSHGPDVDTQEDLKQVATLLQGRSQ